VSSRQRRTVQDSYLLLAILPVSLLLIPHQGYLARFALYE
jgi:hypothetical protein